MISENIVVNIYINFLLNYLNLSLFKDVMILENKIKSFVFRMY